MNPVGTDARASRSLRIGRPGWLRISIWVISGVACFALVLFVTATIVLHTRAFHNYALNKVRAVASEQLGTQVDLQNFTVSLSTLSFNIYGLTIHGAAPYANLPLLQVQHAQVGVRIVSIPGRKWYLNNLQIDSPVAKVFTDANGNS